MTQTIAVAETTLNGAYHLPPEKLHQAVLLSHLELTMHFAFTLVTLLTLWLLLRSGLAAKTEAIITERLRTPRLRTFTFIPLLITALSLVMLPLDAAAHQVALSFGISVEGWTSWTVDLLKEFALTLAIGTPLLSLLHRLTRRSPRHYWLFAWICSVPLLLVATFLLPTLIEPLFYSYEPLSQTHPVLTAAIEQVVARTGTSIPPNRIYLMHASNRTNGLNAYVSGLGPTKRIVVWDTTADRIPADQVLFIFAHESGHYVLHHIAKGILCTVISTFVLFWLAAHLAACMLRRNPHWRVASLSTYSGLIVLLFAASLLQIPAEPIGNFISRYFEHQADVYGQEAIHGLVLNPQQTAVSAFQSLGEAWLEDPSPNALLEFWTSSHPSTQHRATFAAGYNPWTPGLHPRFFPQQ